MKTNFDAVVSACRQAYGVYQQLAGRTDVALYQALGHVHSLCLQIRSEPMLDAAWRELLHQYVGEKPVNETLFLVKYVFFPDTLQPGPGHKSDITKASRYAKLINQALDRGIEPADFVAFARDQGIQRTAAGSRPGSRSRVVVRPVPHSPRVVAQSGTIRVGSRLLATVLAPLEAWLSSAELAARLALCLGAAQRQPQQLSLTLCVNDQTAVVTGVTAQAYHGDFPAGTVRAGRSVPVPSPATIAPDVPPAKRSPQFLGSASQSRPHSSHRRATPVRRRQSTADGLVWPSWRSH